VPRPKLPDEEKKGCVLRTRTQPWLFMAVKERATANGQTVSAEIISILTATLTSGATT
jgi:hypothetical protein